MQGQPLPCPAYSDQVTRPPVSGEQITMIGIEDHF